MIIPNGMSFFENTHVVAEVTRCVETQPTENDLQVDDKPETVVLLVNNTNYKLDAGSTKTIVKVEKEMLETTEEVVEEMPETTEEIKEETIEYLDMDPIMLEEDKNLTVAEKWERILHTGTLTARKGYIVDSPCGGSETWYTDAPIEAVKMLEELYGFENLKMETREKDGVRVLSGTMPNGEEFEELVVVAADVRDITDKFERNINGTFDRGEIVETSLGTGIVVDYYLRAVNERKATGHIHIDIATDW